MNDRVNESFSAFLDGEASEVDIQRMLKALDSDPRLLDEWHRLSRVQAALAGDVLVDIAPQSGIEEPEGKPVESSSSRWRLRLGQGAVAAAVALVVIVGSQWQTDTSEAAPQIAGKPDLEASQSHFEAQQRLHSYLRQHAEAASYSSGHAVVPYELPLEVAE